MCVGVSLVRGSLAGVSYLFLPCGFWYSDSGHYAYAWWLMPLPTESALKFFYITSHHVAQVGFEFTV